MVRSAPRRLRPQSGAKDGGAMTFRSLFVLAVLVAFLLMPGPGATQADDAATSCRAQISGIENEHTHALAARVLMEAYRRIGCQLSVDFMPGKRSLTWANDGLTQGDVARIEGTDKVYTNLVQVPTPVLKDTLGVAFAIEQTGPVDSMEDLEGLRIGIIQGIRYSEALTKGMNPVMANDMTHLFSLLVAGRIDVAIAILNAGTIEAARNFNGKGIHPISDSLYTSSVYHFVNEGYGDRVPLLDAALREMAAEGVTETIIQDAIVELSSP